jgi:hypothetical protein
MPSCEEKALPQTGNFNRGIAREMQERQEHTLDDDPVCLNIRWRFEASCTISRDVVIFSTPSPLTSRLPTRTPLI